MKGRDETLTLVSPVNVFEIVSHTERDIIKVHT